MPFSTNVNVFILSLFFPYFKVNPENSFNTTF